MLAVAIFRQSTFKRSCQLLSTSSIGTLKARTGEPEDLHIVARFCANDMTGHMRPVGNAKGGRESGGRAVARFMRCAP